MSGRRDKGMRAAMRCLMMGFGLLILSGCHAPRAASCHRPQLHRHLVFDAHPGSLSADSIRFRSDWPSVERGWVAPDVLFYHERLVDLQYTPYGRGFADFDRTYRRVDSVRIGHEVR